MPNLFPKGYFDDSEDWDHGQQVTEALKITRQPPPRKPMARSSAAIHVFCDYCGQPAKLVNGDEIYQHRKDLHHKKFWDCISCDAWVGCHPNSIRPLGRLANATLRKAKKMAHESFDKLWRNGGMTRSRAYAWLAERMELPEERCHIGMFDEYQCAEVLIHCSHGVSKHAR